MTFRPCDACGRHVRRGEACPFCQGKRPGRVIVAGVLGLGLVACSPSPVPVQGPQVPLADAGAPASADPPPLIPVPDYGIPPLSE